MSRESQNGMARFPIVLALILIVLTVMGAVAYEISRRRAERQARQESAERDAVELIAQRTGEITA